MDKDTTQTLLALNLKFYSTFAAPFASSRSTSDPALVSILPYVPQRARVLDVGCGNGRLALLLDRERPGTTYLGLDAVPELVEIARAQADEVTAISVEFRVADVGRPCWSDAVRDTPTSSFRPEPAQGSLMTGFDCAVALAVVHHVPSFELRAQALNEIGSLLKPSGFLVLSTWQFLGSERMRQKIVPWTEVGIAEDSLDPGDYLLDWKGGGRGVRYCHLVDAAEVAQLAAESRFVIRETFRAGGREGNLSLFAILDKEGVEE